MPAPTTLRASRWLAPTLIAAAAIALAGSFSQAVTTYLALADGGASKLVFGVPVGAFGMSLATVAIVLGAALMATRSVPPGVAPGRSLAAASAVLGSGVVGWYAAFALAADKVVTLQAPTAELSCNLSLLVQCGANLQSWQGSVFGFPNPLIGLAGWSAVITVGCLMLAGIRLAPWFWIAFNVGVAVALGFVVWLIGQSVFVLGTLCPWCMVTWATTILLFWAVTLRNARLGYFGSRLARVIGPASGWVPLITLASYIAVAVVAQLRLDALSYL